MGAILTTFPITSMIAGSGYQRTLWVFGLVLGAVFGGPLAALLHDRFGSWLPVFYISAGRDLLTALLAFFVFKPLHQRWAQRSRPGVDMPLGVALPAGAL